MAYELEHRISCSRYSKTRARSFVILITEKVSSFADIDNWTIKKIVYVFPTRL
jgi:hypothetical protein